MDSMGVSMSEIQRYEFSNGNFGFADRIASESGRYVAYTDLLTLEECKCWYQRQYWMALTVNIVVVLVCAVLAALLVQEKAARGPVAVPMGIGEKAELLKEVHAAKVAKDQAQADLKKARADYVASQAFFATRAKELEGKIAKDIQSLESPAARWQDIDRLNREQAQRMSTRQGFVLEAKRVLGVEHVQIVDR